MTVEDAVPRRGREGLRRTRHLDRVALRRRAWRLLGLHALAPGSAQLVAGSRSIGRVAVFVWALTLGLVAVGLFALLVQPATMLDVLASPSVLTAVQVVVLVLLIGWIALTVDVLRLLRLRRLRPAARVGIAAVTAIGVLAVTGVCASTAVAASSARTAVTAFFPVDDHAAPASSAAAPERWDVLLVGMDRTDGRGPLTPKSLAVLSIDASTGRSTLIGVPVSLKEVPFPASSPMHRLYPDGYRDCIAKPCTLADVAREGTALGASAYPDAAARGSTPAVLALQDAVGAVIGRTLRYSLVADTAAFGRLVDAVGGVRLVQGGREIRMDGAAAVRYLRGGSAAGEGIDRLLDVGAAMQQEVNPANALLQVQRVAGASAGVLRTDMPRSAATDAAVRAIRSLDEPVRTVRLTQPREVGGRPDWTGIRLAVASTD